MTLREIITDIKIGVLIFAATLIAEMFLIWSSDTDYWRVVAEAFKNLGG